MKKIFLFYLGARIQGGYFHAELPSIQANIGVSSIAPSAPAVSVDVNVSEKTPLIAK